MATFPDLSQFDHFATESTDRTLTLPIRGREYTWDARRLSLRAMLTMQRVDAASRKIAAQLAAGEKVDRDALVLDDREEQQFGLDLIGPEVLARMADDGVEWREVQHLIATLIAWYLHGEQAAYASWTAAEEATPADPPARAASTKTAGSSTRKPSAKSRSAGPRSSSSGRSSRRTSTASTK